MDLDFSRLRRTNLERCVTEFKHPLSAWSIAEWCCAMIGEAGEACNIAKKLIRIRDGMNRFNDRNESQLLQDLADELADTVIYADLVATSQGIDLGKAVIDKFNRDSAKHGAKIRLAESL